jgi:cyclophilin family peptidyl-prolyl cis-trans isomerase
MAAKKSSSSRKRSRPVAPKKTNPNIKIIGILAVIAIVIVVAVTVLYIGRNTDGNQNNGGTSEGNSIAVIDTSMGTIKVELYEDKVPNTCENFIKLANDGFYSGLVFHRVANLIPDKPETHIIQGGGFTSDGTKKESPYGTIDLEINHEVRHVDGAIAMARTNDPNSATSQFYICDGAQSFLDDNYAAFGVVIDGMDVLRDIASVSTTTKNGMNNWPVNDVTINSITIENQ